jgi:O-antigen ligase
MGIAAAGSLLILAAWVLTFSAASLVFVPLAFVVALMVVWPRSRHSRHETKAAIGALAVLAAGAFFVVSVGIGGGTAGLTGAGSPTQEVISPLIQKAALSSTETGARPQRWAASIEHIARHPFIGTGLGTGGGEGRDEGPVSWILLVAVESGLIGLGLVVALLLVVLRRMISSDYPGRLWFLMGFFAAAMHLMVISTFYDWGIWLVAAIALSVQDRDGPLDRKGGMRRSTGGSRLDLRHSPSDRPIWAKPNRATRVPERSSPSRLP